ncbi:DDE superfamily endonuclease [Popillia japonica]|uniref:DDE superfamily endonuclease n=1 Tax=Popillia japonica TaxID=7064 RepID=A0AAW1K0W6_POPJA
MSNNANLLKCYHGGYAPVSPQKSLLMFLRYLATDESILSISNRFEVAPSTLHKSITTMLNIFVVMRSQYVFWKKTVHEFEGITAQFKKYPGICGVIDGYHIKLKVSEEDHDSYIDRYHQHSVNLMAVCTKSKLLTYIFVGFPGSAHDSRVFKNSEFYMNIEKHGINYYFPNHKYHIIGDSAFGCYPWLLTPIKNPRTIEERYHNYVLSTDRVVIENVFGLLKGRGRKLHYIDVYSISRAIKIIVAACVLHNWCIIDKDVWTEVLEYEKFIKIEAGIDTREWTETEKRRLIAYT